MDLKKRGLLSIILLSSIIGSIFGIILIILGIWHSKTMLRSGINILFLGAVFFFKYRRIYQDEEKAKEFTNQNNDERYRFLSQKSMSWTFLISHYAKYVAMLILFLLKKDNLGLAVCYWVLGEMVIMFICYFVASKKY